MAAVHAALVGSLAPRRWAEGAGFDAAALVPAVGRRYTNKRKRVIRRGRVLECQRPVSLIFYETLTDPPCQARLRFRWRLEPVEGGSLLRLEVTYDLNGAASLRKRHWNSRIAAHCARMLGGVSAWLERAAADPSAGAAQSTGTIGHSHGSSSIVVTKTTAVSGKPTLR